MHVWGIGLSRTGTKSLFNAFRALGFEPATHYLHPEEWENVGQYKFANDLPIPARFEELDRRFPNSKFIYTIRPNMKQWLRSNEIHVARLAMQSACPEWMESYQNEMYGVPRFDRACFQEAYRRHDEHVRDYFQGRDDFLVMNIVEGDGWEKLIPFVGLENTRFPHLNQQVY